MQFPYGRVSLAPRCTVCCPCLGPQLNRYPSAKKYDLLPMFGATSGTQVLRSTICCQCLGLKVVPSAEMYDLLPVSGKSAKTSVLVLQMR